MTNNELYLQAKPHKLFCAYLAIGMPKRRTADVLEAGAEEPTAKASASRCVLALSKAPKGAEICVCLIFFPENHPVDAYDHGVLQLLWGISQVQKVFF